MQRVSLWTGQEFYRTGIQMHLLDQVVRQSEQALADGSTSFSEAFASAPGTVFSEDWIDLGGQLMPRGRLDDLCAGIESGELADLQAVNTALDKILAVYGQDQWGWVKWAFGNDALSEPSREPVMSAFH